MAKSIFTQTTKFPGWWVVGACFILLSFSSGLGFYGLAVYLQAFSRELGWSVSSISLATTFFFLVGGVSGIPIAKFIAKQSQLEVQEVERRAQRKAKALTYASHWVCLALVAREQGLVMDDIAAALSVY